MTSTHEIASVARAGAGVGEAFGVVVAASSRAVGASEIAKLVQVDAEGAA